MKKYTFSKAERLKSDKAISRLFKEGKHFFKYPIKMVYLKTEEQAYPVLFTCSVSKRSFKRAVDRNRIKRLIREAYRLNKHILWDELMDKSIAYIAMAVYVGKDELPYETVEKSIKILLKRISQSTRPEE